jgi:3-deoxy-D-manno-octulosonic-acid transferase
MGLGVRREDLEVTGTMKFDAATVGDTVPGAEELAREVGLPTPTAVRSDPAPEQASDRTAVGVSDAVSSVLVAGSTGPGEEELVLSVYARLLQSHDKLRLVIVPRKPERFDEVAKLIESRGYPCVRRSKPDVTPDASTLAPVVLGDTMGELRKFYALATVVFVGRTLVDLGSKQHGSDMIEPCALAKPTVVGPFTGNFEEPMRAFRSAGAIREVMNDQELFDTLEAWLSDPESARALGRAAREVVIAGKGAVQRHVDVLLPLLV